MRKRLTYAVTRPIALLLAMLLLVLWQAPPAAAFRKRPLPQGKTQTPDAELKAKIEAKERPKAVDMRELTGEEMKDLTGRGIYRNGGLCGTMPWHRSLRDVNLCTGNLFKSFTDIQVQPARGAGLAFQRTYNSNESRVGPFGVGWTDSYDFHISEAGDNNVPRSDFFGGQHTYTRDADGLYSPPPYLYDEMSSEYTNELVTGPADIVSDIDKGMDGTVKHYVNNGDERDCDYIQDRHGNTTTFTYGTTVSVGGGVSRALLTQVTDPSGRYLNISWTNEGTTEAPAWRITQVQGPFDGTTPVYTVTYEYNGDANLWKVHQDPSGLNRTTTFTYTTYDDGMGNVETGLLASISDPLSHTVSYSYDMPDGDFTSTVWVVEVDEPGSGGTEVWNIAPYIAGEEPWPVTATAYNNDGLYIHIAMDVQLTYGLLGPGQRTIIQVCL